MSVLAKIEPKTLARADTSREVLPDSELALLRDSMCRGADETEFNLFVRTCRHLRLNPLAKQIYWFKDKGGRVSTITSADGFRLIAQRTGEYEGQTAPQWCGKDGVWRDVWLGEGAPYAARVGVYRRGFREPLYAVARVAAYSKNQGLWLTMADVLSAKCAEVLALRKAFPNELSGVYATEEMEQAGFSGDGAYLDAEQTTIAARKAKEKDDSDALCDEWIAEVEKFTEAEHVAKFLHYNGAAMRTMHANAKQRFWRRLLKVGERVQLGAAAMKDFIAEAPEFPHDEDGVVNGEVMEGEAAQ